MKKKIFCLLNALLLLFQCACGAVPTGSTELDGTLLPSDDLTQIKASSSSTIKNVVAVDKAYVRGGEWADKDWNQINAERKAQGLISSDYIVVKSGGENGLLNSSYTRIALFKYDISELSLDDIGYVTFSLKFTDMDTSKVVPFDIYWVNENWSGDSVTWNTKPQMIDDEPILLPLLTVGKRLEHKTIKR